MDKETFKAAIDAARKSTINGIDLSKVGEAQDVSLGINRPGKYLISIIWYGTSNGPANARTPWAKDTPTLIIGVSSIIDGETTTPVPVMMKQANVARLVPPLQSAKEVKLAYDTNGGYEIEVERSREGIPVNGGRDTFYPMVLKEGCNPTLKEWK